MRLLVASRLEALDLLLELELHIGDTRDCGFGTWDGWEAL